MTSDTGVSTQNPSPRHFAKLGFITLTCSQKHMIEEMSYLPEHLSSLRQEIADLQKMNTHYSNKSEHSPLDKSALEVRTVRLTQIKKELANLLDRPNDPKIWWEKR